MNPVVIYIGKDEQQTIYFSRLLSSVLPENPILHGNYKQAAEWLATHSEEKSTVILYERDSSDADLEKIKYLRDEFPYIYILLVRMGSVTFSVSLVYCFISLITNLFLFFNFT